MTTATCKRRSVGEHAFWYDPITEDISEVEIVSTHNTGIHIRTLRGSTDHTVCPEELNKGENEDE